MEMMEMNTNLKLNLLRNGFIEKDGKTEATIRGVKMVGLDAVCDTEGGIDGTKLLEKIILTMTEHFEEDDLTVEELRNIAKKTQHNILKKILTDTDIDVQIANLILYVDLVSKKVEKNVRKEVASNFIDKLKKVEKAYEDTYDELDEQKAITDKAIRNEIAAKEELSIVKKRADKQQRIADHKIAALEKEIELLKAQLNK